MASLESACELFWSLREGYIQPSPVGFSSPLPTCTSLEESPYGIGEAADFVVSRLQKLVFQRRTKLWRLRLWGLVQIILEKLLKLVRVINNSDSVSGVMGEECHSSRVPLMLSYAKALDYCGGWRGSIDRSFGCHRHKISQASTLPRLAGHGSHRQEAQ